MATYWVLDKNEFDSGNHDSDTAHYGMAQCETGLFDCLKRGKDNL